jgi:hypothetical protein
MSKRAAAVAVNLPDFPREVGAFADSRVPDLVMRPERTSATVSRVTGQVRRALEADCATGGLDEEDSLEDPLTVANTLEVVALDVLELVVVSLRALGPRDDRPSPPVSYGRKWRRSRRASAHG